MSAERVAGKIDLNTGVTLGVLIAVVGAAWTGGQRLARIEEHISQLQASQVAGQDAVRDLGDWRHEHETWASTETARQRAAVNEIRRKLNMPPLPYSESGSGFQPADRERRPPSGRP